MKQIPKRVAPLFAKTWGGLLHEALQLQDPESWFDFFSFPKCTLWAPERGGKRISKSRSKADVVHERLVQWRDSKKQMWETVMSRDSKGKKRESKDQTTARLEKRVSTAIKMGDVRKALQMFTAAPIAPKTEETFNSLLALHPHATRPVQAPINEPSASPYFNDKLVREALATFSPSSAAGLFGYRPFILQQCARAESFHFVPTLARAVNYFASGSAPDFLQPFLAGGVSIALAKPNNGVRPLCCGDSIRRLVGKCFCLGGKNEISESFHGKNFGVGCPGGVEIVAHSLRDVLRKHKDSDLALLKIDFRNAFNMMDRDTFVQATSTRFPALERWTRWCYEKPPLLIYDHERKFVSESGVQQGDPLGPLYFCCGLQSIVDEISELGPVYQKWYMDDGGIIGPRAMLLDVWDILRKKGPMIGLILNPSKCEWSWLNRTCIDPVPLDGVQYVETDKIQMLGVPLGSDEFVATHVGKELLPVAKDVLGKLADFEDSQIAMYLLRLSYGIIRANHFMRTTPLLQWGPHATKFDELARETTEKILKTVLSTDAYEQACVSPRGGGFGIRRVVDHAPVAFNASWVAGKNRCGENWTAPVPNLTDAAPSQRVASESVDQAIMSKLLDKADKREKQRLSRLKCEHANAWVTALPSETDGKDTILPPPVFIAATCRLLGLPVMKSNPCPQCEQKMDSLGDHAICCRKTGDTITRHNRLRNLMCKLAEQGLLNPELEKAGILGHTDKSKRRPGDVTIPLWNHGRGLAIDVAVICPVAESHLSQSAPCEAYAEKEKHATYDAGFKGTNYDFAAMVFETSGGVNEEGRDVVRQLIRFASKREGAGNSSFAGRTWSRISCSIQYSVAQAILNRSGED